MHKLYKLIKSINKDSDEFENIFKSFTEEEVIDKPMSMWLDILETRYKYRTLSGIKFKKTLDKFK